MSLFNGVTLPSITKHEYSIVILSERLIDLTHPLIWGHRILFDKDCFILQMRNVTLSNVTQMNTYHTNCRQSVISHSRSLYW